MLIVCPTQFKKNTIGIVVQYMDVNEKHHFDVYFAPGLNSQYIFSRDCMLSIVHSMQRELFN